MSNSRWRLRAWARYLTEPATVSLGFIIAGYLTSETIDLDQIIPKPTPKSYIVAVIIVYVSSIVGFFLFLYANYFARKRERWSRAAIAGMLLTLPALILPWLFALSSLIIREFASLQNPHVVTAIKVPSVVAATAALLLFSFRLKFRMLYGVTKACLGIVVAYRLASAATEPMPLIDPNFVLGFLIAQRLSRCAWTGQHSSRIDQRTHRRIVGEAPNRKTSQHRTGRAAPATALKAKFASYTITNLSRHLSLIQNGARPRPLHVTALNLRS